MSRLVEAVLPARMGAPFRWLVGSSWVGNLGDGIGLAAGPLLVASQKVWGITGPFWFAFAGSALLLALLWRELAHIAHADEAELARTA